MARLLLGLDSGLTATKAVVFDEDGRALGTGSVASDQDTPHPGWVEKDPEAQWRGACKAIRAALADAGAQGRDVAAVAPTGHGDGVYTLGEDLAPVRPAITSLDGRAGAIVERFRRDGVSERVLELAGEAPFAVEAPVLLAWLKDAEPERYACVRHVMWCKDWLKLKLTGEVSTDPTEASTGLTSVRTRDWSHEALALFGLEELADALPPVIGCAEVAGEVTAHAADASGLAAGTPVVSGLHDCDASAVGVGAVRPGTATMIAGTFSINEALAEEPVIDARTLCRAAPEGDGWMIMANSATSATNLEWFVRELAPLEAERARARGDSPYAWAEAEVAAVLDDDARVLFLPFLYGSPEHPAGSAVLFGLQGWHKRGHALRALFEGVAFSHRRHVDALREHLTLDDARLAGGGARSAVWAQVFADAVGLPVTVTAAAETGALGAAICAGVAAGVHPTISAGADAWVRPLRTFEPDSARRERLQEAYERYVELAGSLGAAWERASATGASRSTP